MTASLAPIDLAHGMILSDEVYARIGAAILDGTLPPGERLRDVDLALQLGISRTPVREALQRLERYGLVEIAVGRFTRVSQPDDKLRADTAAFTAYTMGSALRLASVSATDEQLAAIVSAADTVVGAAESGDTLRLFDAAVNLFVLVTRATGNTVLIGVMREASLAIQRNLRGWGSFLDGPSSRTGDYAALRDCMASRDGDGAEAALRRIHGLS